MAEVSFFTPIIFINQPKSYAKRLLAVVDDYFYLGGRQALAYDWDPWNPYVTMENGSQSLLKTSLKVISYFTIFLPLIPLISKTGNKSLSTICFCSAFLLPAMLLTKIVLRYMYPYEIFENKEPSKIDKPRLDLDEKASLNAPEPDQPTPSIKPLAHQPLALSIIDTLGLDLDETCTVDTSEFSEVYAQFIPTKTFTLRQAITDVINAINKAIREKTDANSQASIEEKHNITLTAKAPWMKGGSNLYFYEQYCPVPTFFPNYEQLSKVWLNKILKALVDKNYIQLKTSSRGTGYQIQV